MSMRVMKGLGIVGLLAAVLGALAAENTLHSIIHDPLPPAHGRIELAGLRQPVKVYRDDWGAPHIHARTDADAFFAMGYVAAQERLFQMDLLRRLANGRLAEIIGPAGLPHDKLARIVGFRRNAERALPVMDPATLPLGEAYVAGVNAFMAGMGDALPIEFRVLGYRPEPWTMLDSAAMGRLQGWQLSMNWVREAVRVMLVAERGEATTALLMQGIDGWGPYILNAEQRDYAQAGSAPVASAAQVALAPALRDVAAALLAAQVDTPFVGHAGLASNNWVVAGSKTASGKPILSNDPHLALPMPGVWLEVRVKSPTLDITGVMFPGLPLVPLGHTRYAAWGATTTVADTQDLYIEQPHPSDPEHLYVVPGGVKRYRTEAERIVVKGTGGHATEYVDLQVRISRHGPIINDLVPDLPDGTPPLALRWTGAEPSDEFTAFLAVARATNWDEFRAAIGQMGTPVQNWVFAAINGDIGYICGGRIPIRAPGHDPRLPVPGHTDEFEWRGWIPLDELPQVKNPPAGYVASANNKVAPPAYPYYLQDSASSGYRAARIQEVLADATQLTLTDMARLQLDDFMVMGRRIAPHIIRAARAAGAQDATERDAFAALEAWDYRASAGSTGATVFHAVMEHLKDGILEDEMSPLVYERGYRHQFNLWLLIDRMCNEGHAAVLWDDRGTEATETADDILAAAFRAGVADLAEHQGRRVAGWRWGDLHQQHFAHVFSQVAPGAGRAQRNAGKGVLAKAALGVVDRYFGAGPFPLNGSGTTTRASAFNYFEGTFDATWGVSYRHIIDMADVASARSVITTGNSGHVASPHYRDQAPLWARGDYHPMVMDFEPGEKTMYDTLVLAPARAHGGAS